MRVAPCEEPRAWPGPNCSSSTAGTSRAASARAVAEPSRPAPTTAMSTRSTAATIAGARRPAVALRLAVDRRLTVAPAAGRRSPAGRGSAAGLGSPVLGDERDLSRRATGHDAPVGLGGLIEREGLRHEDPQRPLGGKPGQFQPGGVADLRSRVRARRPAENLDALTEAAREAGDGGDPCPVGDQLERDVEGLVRPDK